METHDYDQRLFSIQDRYKNGDSAALQEMYQILFEFAYKTINLVCKTSEQLAATTAEERKQKAHDAATYVIEQYLKRPDFVIEKSITGYLGKRINKELYYARKCDRLLIFTDELPEIARTRKEYKYIVTDTRCGLSWTYESLQELCDRFPKLRSDKFRKCINTGELYKCYTIKLLEIDN